MWIRSAAFSCAFACGAYGRRPGGSGHRRGARHPRDRPGLDIFDLFGDDDQKSSLHHPRPGAEDFGGQAARTVGITTSDAGPPMSTFGSVPESAGRREWQRWHSRKCWPWRKRRRRGAPQRERRPVIEPAVRAVRPDHPQHRHSRGATRRHTRAGVRAARAATGNWRHSIGHAAAEPAGARRTADACRTAGTRARSSHEKSMGAECFRPQGYRTLSGRGMRST